MNSDIMHLSDGYNEEYAQGEQMAMTMMVLMVINVYDDDAGVYGDAYMRICLLNKNNLVQV